MAGGGIYSGVGEREVGCSSFLASAQVGEVGVRLCVDPRNAFAAREGVKRAGSGGSRQLSRSCLEGVEKQDVTW